MATNSLGATVKQLQMVKCQSKICALHTALWELFHKIKLNNTVAELIPTTIFSLKNLMWCLKQATQTWIPVYFTLKGRNFPISVMCLEIQIFNQTRYETAGKSGRCLLFLIITSHLFYQLFLWLLALGVKYSSRLPWLALQISSFTFFIIKAVLENDMFTSVLRILCIYTAEISELGF